MRKIWIIFTLSAFLFSCGGEQSSVSETSEGTSEETVNENTEVMAEEAEEDADEDFDKNANSKSPYTEKDGTIDGVAVSMTYNSPKVRDRVIFGELVPYGKIWRTGADNASTVTFEEDVMFGGQELAAGTYALFTIPQEEKPWTVVLSKNAKQWGVYDYNEEEDALRVEVEAMKMEEMQEDMTFEIMEDGIKFSWADQALMIPVKRKTDNA